MGQNRQTKTAQGRKSLNIRNIFRCMMEEGYYPVYEKTHIIFEIEDNTAVLSYEEGIVSIRIFFSIDDDCADLFLETSNVAMLGTFIVKPILFNNMQSLMFSCEIMCDTLREFRKFLPRSIELLRKCLETHKSEMKRMILSEKISSATISAAEDIYLLNKGQKILS